VRVAVENVWKGGFTRGLGGFWEGGCGNLLFHVERFGAADERADHGFARMDTDLRQRRF